MSCLSETIAQTPAGHIAQARASFYSSIHGREHAIMFTVQPRLSSKRHPLYLISFHLRLADREIDRLTTDKMSDAEPIRMKLPTGKKLQGKEIWASDA